MFGVKPRSLISKQWVIEGLNGTHTMIHSSLDSEDLYKEFAHVVGNDIISTLIIGYWCFEPTPDGTGTRVWNV
jgi:hypothetical protein